MKRFEEIKRKFKHSNKYILTVDYQDIKDLIFLVEVLRTGNKKKLNSLYGFCVSEYISKGRIRQIIYAGMKHKINNEWRLKIKEKLCELDKNERERSDKIKNCNEMFPDLIYISNKKILEQLLKEGESNV